MQSDRHGFRTHPLALGLALALTHALLLVYLASQRPDMGPPEPSHPHAGIDYVNADAYSRSVIAGRSFHFSDGPLLFKLLFLVDLPALLLSEVVKVSRDLPGEGSNRRRPSRRRATAADRFPGLGSEALSRLPEVRAAESTGLAAARVRLHAGTAVR